MPHEPFEHVKQESLSYSVLVTYECKKGMSIDEAVALMNRRGKEVADQCGIVLAGMPVAKG